MRCYIQPPFWSISVAHGQSPSSNGAERNAPGVKNERPGASQQSGDRPNQAQRERNNLRSSNRNVPKGFRRLPISRSFVEFGQAESSHFPLGRNIVANREGFRARARVLLRSNSASSVARSAVPSREISSNTSGV